MKFLTTSLALAAVLLMATSGLALERTPMQMIDDSRGNDWNAATTVTVAYYNFCQGWIWVWGGWSPGDQCGTAFDMGSLQMKSTALARRNRPFYHS